MTRRALIISNPGELGAENYCEGVNKDVINYKKYLMSSVGGGWYEDEIVCLEKPDHILLNKHIKLMEDTEYTLIIFCGHGCTVGDETIIELNKDCDYRASSLRTGAIKRTIILDCCRVINNSLSESAIYEYSSKLEKSDSYIPLARIYFDAAIQKCNNGIVTTFACDLNETAGDDSRLGGYYSYSLIKSAQSWERQLNNSSASYASIVTIHEKAATMTRMKSGNEQNPQIDKPRNSPYFPFAIHV